MCLIHDILSGFLASIFCLSSALECKHAWHRNQNKLVLKEKVKKKQEKKETGKKKQEVAGLSFKLSYITESELVVLSQGKKFGSLDCFIKGTDSLLT